MRFLRPTRSLLAAFAALVLASPAVADDDGPAPDDAAAAIETAPYFPVDPAGDSVYRKTTQRRGRTTKVETLRRSPVATELAGGDALRIEDSEGEYQVFGLVDGAPVMGGQSMRAQGFEQRYDPPLRMFPAEARPGKTERFSSTVRHMTERRNYEGSIERKVTFEARDAVTVPAGRFADCLRFRASTENRPGVGGAFMARSDEQVWLARGVGEVKRVDRVRLSTLGVTWLDVTIVYELVSPPASAEPSEPREAAEF